MTLTLDQLLEVTGVGAMSGKNLTKTAAVTQSPDLSKLAERCRRAAEATPDETSEAQARVLIEKTAEVEIISRTINEIRAIEGKPVEKTAAPVEDKRAQFIKMALDEGYEPHEVAEFLEKLGGIGSSLGQMWSVRKATRLGEKAMGQISKGERIAVKSTGEWAALFRRAQDGSKAQKEALVSKLRKTYGDKNAAKLLGGLELKGFKHTDEWHSLFPKGRPIPGAKPALAANIGGKEYGVTGEQLSRAAKPAAMIGAGAVGYKVMSGKKDGGGGSRRGVTIVN
jgi:hypothetical protein